MPWRGKVTQPSLSVFSRVCKLKASGTKSSVIICSKKAPNLLLAWLVLEVINVVLNIVSVTSTLVTAASGVIPELADQMADAGIAAEDVPTVIWALAIVVSGIYIAATG